MATIKPEKLPEFLIESLYRHCLVMESSSAQEQNKEEIAPEKREVLVVVHAPNPQINQPQSTFLLTILKACKIESSQVNIISTADPLFGNYNQLSKTFGAVKWLLFGVEPLAINLPMHFPPFQIQSHQTGKYLWAPSLEQLEMDKAQKLTLWNSLQKFFKEHE